MNIKEKIKKLPCTPGVYLMKDSLDTIIYVGKSKSLRNRVGLYFLNVDIDSFSIDTAVDELL